jgi:hypothetical protein
MSMNSKNSGPWRDIHEAAHDRRDPRSRGKVRISGGQGIFAAINGVAKYVCGLPAIGVSPTRSTVAVPKAVTGSREY